MISDAQEHCERLRIVVDGDARAKNPDRLSRARGKWEIHHFPARKTGQPGRGRPAAPVIHAVAAHRPPIHCPPRRMFPVCSFVVCQPVVSVRPAGPLGGFCDLVYWEGRLGLASIFYEGGRRRGGFRDRLGVSERPGDGARRPVH